MNFYILNKKELLLYARTFEYTKNIIYSIVDVTVAYFKLLILARERY